MAVVQAAFRQVRPIILERAGKVGDAYTDKQDGSPVTATDVAVEKAIVATLTNHFPGVPVFSEEAGYSEDLPQQCWLIDPIDGTRSFMEGTPAYANMAVLMQRNEAVASVIYNVAQDAMYVAQKGSGAYKNGVRLDLGAIPLPAVAFCKGQFIDAINAMLAPRGVTCQNPHTGGGNDFPMVAEGLCAARFSMRGGGYIHDYAPGALLVREAGGVLIPIKDDIYTYKTRSFVACHPDLEAVLQPHIQRLRELEQTN